MLQAANASDCTAHTQNSIYNETWKIARGVMHFYSLWIKLGSYSFYEIDRRGMYYKTFYNHNLQIFVISYSVCPWQAFPG